jgi:hypothetical protein
MDFNEKKLGSHEANAYTDSDGNTLEEIEEH